ncbi:MAG TPA: hypothetical protein VLP30_01140, partial [Desulfatirhabdiaceae bacterium]|nr:hypothetical protein [Desulfatirhabdiaceae bacterium]
MISTYLGMINVAKEVDSPTIRPPTKVPGMLPKPPISTITNEGMRMAVPMPDLMPVMGAARIPDSP